MRQLLAMTLVFLLPVAALSPSAGAEHRIGGGIEYLKTLGDIKDNSEFDPNAFGIIVSYQYNAGLLKLEGDVEWITDFGGTDKALIQPQAYALLGGLIYGGAGIGIGRFDGEWASDPFYAFRAGVNLTLGGLTFDAFGTYRFQDAEMIEGFGKTELDAITFSALVRFSFGG